MKLVQKGFSIVELMVALLLGLIITAAAVQLFVTNHRTFQLQQITSRIHEDGQLLLRFLVRDLRRTGVVIDGVAMNTAMGVQFSNYTWGGNNIPASAESADFDRLTIGFHGETGEQDCEGDAAPAAQEIINTYFVEDSTLRCQGSVNSGTTGVELLGGIEGFEVQYGVDSTKDEQLRADRYVSANAVGTTPVVAVRIAFLLSQESNLLPASEGSFYLLDKKIDVAEDNAIRRQFMATVRLRNYDWDEI
jgi:type IV pilus assembly protein PilW